MVSLTYLINPTFSPKAAIKNVTKISIISILSTVCKAVVPPWTFTIYQDRYNSNHSLKT
ncbi:hypothetical protein ACQKCU_23060 [Heyndrickxia sporothermodurans]